MKNIIIGLAIVPILIAGCNNGNDKATDVKQKDEQDDASIATAQQVKTDAPTVAAFPAKEIIAGYLQLKNALTKDNGKEAATAGNRIVSELAKVEMKTLSKEQMKNYVDISGDLKDHAINIEANSNKIEQQREHFVKLSKDMVDFVKAFGNSGQILYKDFCPMANAGKGATWISEIKEIKNPYFGGKMPECGLIKETIK